ncbi:XRE family transcriptional regulator [Pseudoalteromonas sp. CO325X]|uniref:helix-turn-helix domain-containing protein n=1 Tax=Pseudoalteromonas sp. CO325X TaxID=1777262 RepID=UPI0010238201|nr:helix-turn-helix transcriptional regulator [Pseudoalteromonas sp. CO325X]RZF83740.1 XRE family transcriptional regulator [Pseudoalteromonas sp. CO325X]
MGKFNQLLKEHREQQGMQVKELAAATDLHRNTVSNYEVDRDQPVDFLINFSYLLNYPFLDLMKERVSCANALPEAIESAMDSLLGANKELPGNSYMVEEESYIDIPIGTTVYCESILTKNIKIVENKVYGFINPMNKKFFTARLKSGDNSLHLTFNNPAREDLTFYVEGETERDVFLQALGLVGRVTQATINY